MPRYAEFSTALGALGSGDFERGLDRDTECGHFALLFCKEWQCNEMNGIITLAYTAIVLVAVALEVCLIILNSLKPNKRQNNEQPNSTKQTKAQLNKKTAESAENISLR